MGRVLSLALALISFSCLASAEYDCSLIDFCSAGDVCDREYVLGRYDFCTTDSNHDGVINMFEIVNIYNQIVKDGTCDLECFLDGLGRFPVCKHEVVGSYNLLSGYDGDPTSFSTTDADLWYADLVKYEGKVPVTAVGFRKRFRDVYKMIGDPNCEVPYL